MFDIKNIRADFPILSQKVRGKDLVYFDNMIPCGIRGKAVTSLLVELGMTTVSETEVKEKLLKHFTNLFEAEIKTIQI